MDTDEANFAVYFQAKMKAHHPFTLSFIREQEDISSINDTKKKQQQREHTRERRSIKSNI